MSRQGTIRIIVALVVVLGVSGSAAAGELRFNFINPNFGGNPLNGSYLLGMAGAQNDFTEDKGRDPLQEFEEQLNSRILSELGRRLTEEAFGEEGLRSGNYQLGDYSIDIDTGAGDGISVEIFDFSSGGSTTIEIPRY